MTAQRFRVRFRKAERIRYISHLDVLRYWERAIRRAELPLSYSLGFTPHPKIAFASPLPLGFVGEAELMDVSLDERIPFAEFVARIGTQSSDDLTIVDVEEIALSSPAPQAVLLWADYAVPVTGVSAESARCAVRDFLHRDSFEWTEEKKEKSRTYDLRKAVATLTSSEGGGGEVTLSMRLQADAELTARPEQVLAALFPSAVPGVFRRVSLVIDDPSPARIAWRRRGRFEE